MRDPRLINYAKEMRSEPTEPENRLWHELRAKRLLDTKLRRQKVIGKYITDFSSRDPMLVTEIDGDTHGDQIENDERRTQYLESKGYHVIRFSNGEVTRNMAGVLTSIAELISPKSPLPTLSPEGERALETVSSTSNTYTQERSQL